MHNACTAHALQVHTSRHRRRRPAPGLAADRLALTLCGVLIAFPAGAQASGEIALPSGRVVAFNDVIWGEPGPAGLTVRFRFLEPDLASVIETMDYDALEADMAFLCETYALERIASTGPQPAQIIVSVSDRPVDFGEAAPEATQVFEAYSRDGEACVWEGF